LFDNKNHKKGRAKTMGCLFSKVQDVIDDVIVSGSHPSPTTTNNNSNTAPYHAAVTGTSPVAQHQDDDSSSSPYYKTLPSSAIKGTVRNVYDGDTITLTDERRIRLLGIDTPEIKEKQPFATEAKEYTSNLCNKQEVWLVHEPNYETTDHYGRLLAWVYVKDKTSNRYLCVNEGIIQAGLASVYIPTPSTKFQRQNKLYQFQTIARQQKLYIWKHFSNHQKVVITKNGTAYHQATCPHLSKSHNTIEITAEQALDRGLHPCRKCQS
jgi:endonuclease YncB( thermonuclease family)